jgi:ABC-type cobalamin/Fe3+-siderophores transport system ATPase subunit
MTTADAPLLELRDATVRYGATPALTGASLAVRAGELVAVVGRNASGKSTLLRALAGLVPCEGWLRPAPTPDRVAFVPQRPEVAADFTAREVVRLGRHAVGPDERAVQGALEAVGLAGRAETAVHAMSGGERQRVAVARAFAQLDGGGVLLLDEPFAGIDPGEVARLAAALAARARRGAVVVSLHDPGLARAIATRAVAVAGGRIVADGVADAVLSPDRLTGVYGHEIVDRAAWLSPRLDGADRMGA